LITYVDASVLLRVIQGAPGSLGSWPELQPIASELIRVECLRVVDRARTSHGVDDLVSSQHRASVLMALTAFFLAPISSTILERAADPFPTALGTLDAIHLATALRLREEYAALAFATHDRELATAARAVGFEVEGA
jgi:predicted nucleic acid-binding protein